MIEERAFVLAFDDEGQHRVKVSAERQNACDSCSLKAGCGQSAMTKLAGGKCIELTVANELKARPGDLVLLSIPEQGLLTASLLVYLLPLLLMVFFSVLAKVVFTSDDGITAIVGIMALLGGFGVVRLYANRYSHDRRFTPKIVRILSRSELSP